MENPLYIAVLIALLVFGVILVKKITGCIFRIIVGIVMLAVLYWILTSQGVL